MEFTSKKLTAHATLVAMMMSFNIGVSADSKDVEALSAMPQETVFRARFAFRAMSLR